MKHLQFLVLLLFATLTIHAQSIHINYDNQSLDKILLDLRDEYSIDLSFSDSQVSKYKITIDKDFSSAQKALEFLLLNTSLEIQKFGEVFLIKQKLKIEIKPFVLSVTIVDKKTGERLPYAHLLVNNSLFTSNQNGDFSVKSKDDSLFHVTVNYLGFYPCDTTLAASVNQKLALNPFIYELGEVKISHMQATHKTGEGSMPGNIRLNSFVTNFLPGNGDQSVFDLLRLQPGILAAGEQSSDLLIWGSYEGQSKLMLDGITLFSMKNYNDNISTINPLLVKDLMVSKGGYGIEYNGRVGGIVDITAKDGNKQKLSSFLNINNQTINGVLSVPLFRKQASLLVAVRKTYYELYDQSKITLNLGRNETSIDRTLFPDYNFGDLNVKFSGDLNSTTNYQFNYLLGKDDFTYSLNLDGKQSNFIYEDAEHNLQYGWSAQINHSWQNGMKSQFRISGSMLTKNVNNQQQVGRNIVGYGLYGGSGASPYQVLLNNQIENQIEEFSATFESQAQLGEHHYFKLILGWNQDQTNYVEDSLNYNIQSISNKLNSINFRLNDNWTITKKFNVNAGVIYDLILKYGKSYWQPRINLKYAVLPGFNVGFSFGTYYQQVTQLPQIDDFDHIRYFWLTSDFDKISAQKGVHKVLAFNYRNQGLKLDVNLFQRNTTGLTRFRDYSYQSVTYNGESISEGFDVLLSKTFKSLDFWVSYTYSKTQEHFDYFSSDEFVRALHDQRHELKGALIYHFNKWYFSTNYVYGSGFPDLLSGLTLNDYQRLDIAVNRGFKLKKLNINTGISILNLLNHQNIKYENFYRLEDETGEVTLHAEAVPFTPIIYLNLAF